MLGAGVVGLTTAALLLETRPDLTVTVLADRFTVDTVSDGAAGLFRPSASNFCGPDSSTTKRWVEDSYHHYRKLLAEEDQASTGIKELTAVILSSEHESIVRNSLLEPLLPEYRFLTPEELRAAQGGTFKHGCQFRTLLVEDRRYMPYLMRKIEERGGTIRKRSVKALQDLAGEFDIIINCTGLGARELCGDTSLTPIRGQVFKVKAPWIKQCLYADFDTYIIPGIDYVTLGGCRQFDSWTTTIDKHDANSIWERCLKIMPSLRNAQIVREWAGLRPYRPVVRVEKECLTVRGGGTLKVVHNYGHGGYGVTCAPGTAKEAVRMVLEMLPPPRSKL